MCQDNAFKIDTIYKEIVIKFKELISKWKKFRSIRLVIEDVFQINEEKAVNGGFP